MFNPLLILSIIKAGNILAKMCYSIYSTQKNIEARKESVCRNPPYPLNPENRADVLIQLLIFNINAETWVYNENSGHDTVTFRSLLRPMMAVGVKARDRK